ncbi:uncharacterized protein LOC132305096 [Cornus florida]|uniref:uncharacterized protein LOC132305096 n=1 Tax=Cornus florida TaxID=4283 RepID=UPI0028A2D5E4|nr:uncharacterized protein LOC132305096 [Cornus florida]
MTKYFDTIKFQQIPREENPVADRLANAASLADESLTRVVPIDVLETPSIIRGVQVLVIPWEPSWIDPTLAYLERGKLPNSKEAARQLRMKASKYSVIHEEECGNHSGGRSLAHKALTQGYFWPYMAREVKEYSRRCDKCQRFGIPKSIIMDNGPNLDNQYTQHFFDKYGINQKVSATYHPQGNGQAEITNRTIFACIKKKLKDKKREVVRRITKYPMGI